MRGLADGPRVAEPKVSVPSAQRSDELLQCGSTTEPVRCAEHSAGQAVGVVWLSEGIHTVDQHGGGSAEAQPLGVLGRGDLQGRQRRVAADEGHGVAEPLLRFLPAWASVEVEQLDSHCHPGMLSRTRRCVSCVPWGPADRVIVAADRGAAVAGALTGTELTVLPASLVS